MDTDQTTKLVVAVEKRPFIYDKTDPGYSNRNLLNAEWKKIAEEIGCDGKFKFISLLLYVSYLSSSS